jgi:hypothetical protein
MADRVKGRRSANILAETDLAAYTGLVRDAILAFGRDTAYSIDMARAAATIESKRNVWRQRLEARKAEEHNGSLSSELGASPA